MDSPSSSYRHSSESYKGDALIYKHHGKSDAAICIAPDDMNHAVNTDNIAAKCTITAYMKDDSSSWRRIDLHLRTSWSTSKELRIALANIHDNAEIVK